MEYPESITLFSPVRGEDMTSQKAETEMETEWRTSQETMYLMSDKELEEYGEKRNEAMKRKIFSQFSSVIVEPLKNRTVVARQSAISEENVGVISFMGHQSGLDEFLGDSPRKVWEFEPHPNIEKLVAENVSLEAEGAHEAPERVAKADNEKLWKYLEETVERINKSENTRSLDIKNLTPFQAVYVIQKLLNERMNYEDLMGSMSLGEIREGVKSGEIVSGGLEIVEKYGDDSKKYVREVNKYEKRINKMSADQLLDAQFGVCRHFAATAQKLFQLLKERQDGLQMNGSYYLYHSESVGHQRLKSLENNHAYNILVTTEPLDGGGQKTLVSVRDPTFDISRKYVSLDFTYERISQAVSFLYEYGSEIGVENTKKICKGLARKGAERLEQDMILRKELNHFNDFAALKYQALDKPGKQLIHELKETFSAINLDQIDFLLKLADIPVLHYKDSEQLRSEFIEAYVFEIENISFASETEQWSKKMELMNTIRNQFSHFDKKTLFMIPVYTTLNRNNYKYCLNEFRLMNQYARACSESGRQPEKEDYDLISNVYILDKVMRTRIFKPEYLQKMNSNKEKFDRLSEFGN